jgi:hypothetical protein
MKRHFFKGHSTTRQHHALPALRAISKAATRAVSRLNAAKLRVSRLRSTRHSKSICSSAFHVGHGRPDVQLTGHSARLSGGLRVWEGLIVVKLNGGGRGVACRAIKPIGKL